MIPAHHTESKMSPATEELLRYDFSVQGTGRTALEDVEAGGTAIRKGVRLARGQPRPCEPRSAEGDECDVQRCRTAALGGHVARCENAACGHTLIVFNSCRNRHCPKCQAAASRGWLADREAELLPVPYFHSSTRYRASCVTSRTRTSAWSTTLLMKAAAETTLAIAADPKRLGARIGITAVLHTWGSALTTIRTCI